MNEKEPLSYRFIEGFLLNILVILAFALLLGQSLIAWVKGFFSHNQ